MTDVIEVEVGSLFSGIEGIGLGFDHAGARVAWQCEIDGDARKVLAAHWPETPRFTDVTGIHAATHCPTEGVGCDRCVPAVDVLTGGFPCQDISVAGRRAGLAGQRSGLFHQFMRLAFELAPRWVVIENVPGLLSSGHKPTCAGIRVEPEEVEVGACTSCDPGRDMATVLGTLADLGYGWAYRVLDAQYFGVAQRRRRVFIVGCLGDPAAAAQVLFEPESCDGDPPPSRKTGSRVAAGLTAGSATGIGVNRPNSKGEDHMTYVPVEVSPAITSRYQKGVDSSSSDVLIPEIVGQAISSKWAKGSSGPAGDEHHNLVAAYRLYPGERSPDESAVVVAREIEDGLHPTLVSNAGQYIGDRGVMLVEEAIPIAYEAFPLAVRGRADGAELGLGDEEVYNALRAGDGGSSRQALVFRKATRPHSAEEAERWEEDEMAGTLNPWEERREIPPHLAVSFTEGGSGVTEDEVATTVQGTGGKPGQGYQAVREGMQVRRLTPVECMRLQGFPTGWLQWLDGDADQADAAQVLRGMWRTAGSEAVDERRARVLDALLSPEVLLAGVHGNWVSWARAADRAARARAVQGENTWPEGFVRRLWECAAYRPSPYRREPLEQLARELGRSLSEVPLDPPHVAATLRTSGVWAQASEEWLVRPSRSTDEASRPSLAVSDSAAYRLLGNAVAVPVAAWIGRKLLTVHRARFQPG